MSANRNFTLGFMVEAALKASASMDKENKEILEEFERNKFESLLQLRIPTKRVGIGRILTE